MACFVLAVFKTKKTPVIYSIRTAPTMKLYASRHLCIDYNVFPMPSFPRTVDATDKHST